MSRRTETRRRRKWPWVLGGLALLVVIIAVATSGGSSTTQGVGTVAAPATSTSAGSTPVTFEVTGDGKAGSITYGDVGSTSQANGVRMPWHKDIPDNGLTFASLTATRGASDGSITCTIREGDKVIQTNTSEGPYATVSCSGSA